MRRLLCLGLLLFVCSPALAKPSDFDTLLAKSKVLEKSGDRAAALRYAQSAIVANPARVTGYDELGGIYLRNSDPATAAPPACGPRKSMRAAIVRLAGCTNATSGIPR